MSNPFSDAKQAECYFIEVTKRANQNRQKRAGLKEDEIYIAFLDPQSIPPVPITFPNQMQNINQYSYGNPGFA